MHGIDASNFFRRDTRIAHHDWHRQSFFLIAAFLDDSREHLDGVFSFPNSMVCSTITVLELDLFFMLRPFCVSMRCRQRFTARTAAEVLQRAGGRKQAQADHILKQTRIDQHQAGGEQ